MPHSPPLPRFTARVGVTGHRRNHADYAAARIERRLADAMRRIDRAIGAAHEACRTGYAPDPPAIRLVSGLAEGADQLAGRLRPAPWRLDAILPMPAPDYRADFTVPGRACDRGAAALFERQLREADAVLALPGGHGDAPYRDQGGMLVRSIDLLLAVWDGEPSRGPGGTAEVVERALARGLPVAWLPLAVDAPLRLLVGSASDEPRGPAALPALLAEAYDIGGPAPERAVGRSNCNGGEAAWIELLGRDADVPGGFRSRLRDAAVPLLRHAWAVGADDLADAVQAAVLMLPVAGPAPLAPHRMRTASARRVDALTREVGLPTTDLGPGLVAAHGRDIADTVAAPWPELAGRLRRLGRQPSLDRAWSGLAAIVGDLAARWCG